MNKELQIIKDLLNGYPILRQTLAFHFHDEEAILVKLSEYIKAHKWLVNEKIPFEITLEQAMFSWYENVFLPIEDAIRTSGAYSALVGWTPIQVFAAISDAHWATNKLPIKIAYEVIAKNARSWFCRISARFLSR